MNHIGDEGKTVTNDTKVTAVEFTRLQWLTKVTAIKFTHHQWLTKMTTVEFTRVTRHLYEDQWHISTNSRHQCWIKKQKKKIGHTSQIQMFYLSYTSQMHMFYSSYASQVNWFHPLYTLHKVRSTSSRLVQDQATSNGLIESI